MKVVAIIPTNNFNNMMRSLKTINHINGLGIKLSISFQEPFTKEQIEICTNKLDEMNFEYEYITKEKYKDKNFSSVLLRKDLMNLNSDADVFLFMDDNFDYDLYVNTSNGIYTSNDSYKKCIKYMYDNTDCGVIMCRSGIVDNMHHTGIYPCIDSITTIGRGMFIRNTSEVRDLPEIESGGEDVLAAYSVLNKGYYFAAAYGISIIHNDMHDLDIFEKNEKWSCRKSYDYIRSEYNQNDWLLHSKLLPKKFKIAYLALSDRKKYLVGDLIIRDKDSK